MTYQMISWSFLGEKIKFYIQKITNSLSLVLNLFTMSLSSEDIKTILIKSLPSLTEKDIESFLKITNYKVIGANEIILKRGHQSRTAFLILKGAVRGYFICESGTERNSLLRGEGFFMGDGEKLFYNEYHKYTFEAITETHVLYFKYPDFEELAIKNPNIMQWHLSIFKEIMILQNYRIETLISMTADERYLDLIKKNPTFLDKTFSKYVANFLGITPVSLSRIIRKITKNRINN